MHTESASSKHSAPGQLAGYLFQVERALLHLATSGRGGVVEIETADDVLAKNAAGNTTHEQDKSYVTGRTPLADRSKDLWNTLFIWLKVVDAGETDMDKTEFHLVTNGSLSAGIACDLRDLNGEGSERQLQAIVKRLRTCGEKSPAAWAEQADAVLGHTNGEIVTLLRHVRVTDATAASHGPALRKKISDHLVLPLDCADEVMRGLVGWLHDTTLELIRAGKPAQFTAEAFEQRRRQELFAHSDRRFFRETAAAEMPVTAEERAKYQQALFVKQILWLGLAEDNEQLIAAIESVYRSTSETVRLTKQGALTPADFAAFDDRLFEKWRHVRRAHLTTSSTDEAGLQEAGRKVHDQCMDHREMLGGQATQEWYLSQGAFHKLADAPAAAMPRLGWHPRYQDRCKET